MATEQAVRQGDDAEIQYASEGSGPLLQRDYWATFEGTDKTPENVVRTIRERFPDFSPPETAAFRRCDDVSRPLDVGDEMDIRIALLGWCKVRCVRVGPCSITLRTLQGHPEAGRITFGAYRDAEGKLTFRIRSRTRADNFFKFLGFLLMGKQLQSRNWIRFIGRLAESVEATIPDSVHVATSKTRDRPSDWGEADTPTFDCARGGS